MIMLNKVTPPPNFITLKSLPCCIIVMLMLLVAVSSCSKEEETPPIPYKGENLDWSLPGSLFSDEFKKSTDMFHVGHRAFIYQSYKNNYRKDTLDCVSGLRDKKLWMSLFFTANVAHKTNKIYEWISPDTLHLYERIDKYSVVKARNVRPYQMIENENGVVVLYYINVDDESTSGGRDMYNIGLIANRKGMKQVSIVGGYKFDTNLRVLPLYGDSFIFYT